MAKIRYKAAENTKVGTHSFYAIPQFAGTLTADELYEEACQDNTYNVSEMRGCVEAFMVAVQREVQRGFRCQLGKDFLTVYPNLQLSVKDTQDKVTGEVTVATAKMLNAANGKSRLGCTVSTKFSDEFAKNVSWQKVDGEGQPISDSDDATQGNENVDGGSSSDGGTSGGDNDDQQGGGEIEP